MKLFLIRHAESQANSRGILAGRLSGIELSEQGKNQAKSLATSLGNINWTYVYCSPIQRCQDTAKFAIPENIQIQTLLELSEIDYGDWAGQKIEDLQKLDLWRMVQNSPADVSFPGGETFVEAQVRVRDSLKVINQNLDKDINVAFFTHADMIKIFIIQLLNIPLNRLQDFIIDPASITIFEINDQGAKLLKSNVTNGSIGVSI